MTVTTRTHDGGDTAGVLNSLPVKRVLAVGAHPDDVELLCGGTLALYAQAGVEITICSATTGDLGAAADDRGQMAKTRLREAQAAAQLIGATTTNLPIHDCSLDASNGEHRNLLINVIRDANPDVIITHHPADYHADHRATAKLVYDASFMASLPGIDSDRTPTTQICPILHMDTLAGIEFQPEQFVDISPVFSIKHAMLAAHESQTSSMLEHSGLDFLDLMTTQAKLRGYQCGVTYAEGFRIAHEWLRDKPYRLLP